MQIPVINESAYVTDEETAFIVEACHDELAACADAWGQPRNAVVFYGGTATDAVTNGMGQTGRVATIVDDMSDAPGAEAYHTVGPDGVPISRVLAGLGADLDTVSVGLDHENKEEIVDPECDGVVKMPDGKLLAKEVCDPVQGDVRKVKVTIGKVTRDVATSNYVLPSYFDENGKAPYDAFGLVSRPFECRPGGYQEITDPVTGKTDYVFGDKDGRKAYERNLARPGSRLQRRAEKRADGDKTSPDASPVP